MQNKHLTNLVVMNSAVAQPRAALVNFSGPLTASLDIMKYRPSKSPKSTEHRRNSCKINFPLVDWLQSMKWIDFCISDGYGNSSKIA